MRRGGRPWDSVEYMISMVSVVPARVPRSGQGERGRLESRSLVLGLPSFFLRARDFGLCHLTL